MTLTFDEAMRFDLNKKWKYLQFYKDTGSLDGWNLGVSDEPSGVSRDRLLFAAEIAAKMYDEIFYLVFAAVVSDPQLIECSDGLYEVWEIAESSSAKRRWRIFPVYRNRNISTACLEKRR